MTYPALVKLLEDTIGLDPESIGRRTVEHAIGTLMGRLKIPAPDHYLELLRDSPAALEQLIDAVIVPETWFFRDTEPFLFLTRHVQKTWLPRPPEELLTVLSMACSTGEEPYSIVISLLEGGLSPEQFSVDAIDISRKALEQAQQALYRKESFRGKNTFYQSRYFTDTGKGFKLDPAIAGLVNFSHGNFLRSGFQADRQQYHIIFCRNILIYLNQEAREKLLTRIDHLLLPDGILFTGHAEVLFFQQYGYSPVRHPRCFACRKPEDRSEVLESYERKVDSPPTASARTVDAWSTPAGKKQGTSSLPVQTAGGEEASGGNGKKSRQPEKETPGATLAAIRECADRGLLGEAAALCECYLREQSPTAEAYFLLGLIHEASNRIEPAEEQFLKALYLDPSCYDAVVHLSLLYERKGDKIRASLFKERAKRIRGTGRG